MTGRKVRGIVALLIVGIYGALLGCTSGTAPAPSPTPSPPPSPSPSSTPFAETATARPEASPTVPDVSSPSPTEDGIDATQALAVLPLQPAELAAEAMPGEIRIEWPGTGEDLLYYQVSRREAASEEWTPLERVEAGGDNLARYDYTDRTVKAGAVYVYGVTAVNALGATSLITQSDPVTAQ